MDILEKLLGGSARVKIMKLFLFNDEKIFDKTAIARKAKVSASNVTKELNVLEKIKFLRKKSFFKDGKKRADGTLGKKKRVQGYLLNKDFKYISPLQRMLIDSSPMEHREITKRLNSAGKVKLIVVSGLFIQDDQSRIDLLVVGDDMSEKKVKATISAMEAEIGKSLRYSLFDTNGFQYRLALCDRLLRDIFDYPHEVVVDKIGL